MFGAMLGLQARRGNGVITEPRAQALDERNDDAAGFVFGQQAEIAACERSRFVAREHDRFDRRRQHDTREALAQHCVEMRRRARRRAERERSERRRRSMFAMIPCPSLR